MKLFYLERKDGGSGVPATGRVAEGVIFTDGSVVLKWTVPYKPKSTVLYNSINDAIDIHGSGATPELS